jgi:ATP adenylyltransferase
MGRAAGAGIDEHVHYHALPRWNGDTNFMPVFADVRVISEGIDDTYERLTARLRRPEDDQA